MLYGKIIEDVSILILEMKKSSYKNNQKNSDAIMKKVVASLKYSIHPVIV
jgi:hypothetical protein